MTALSTPMTRPGPATLAGRRRHDLLWWLASALTAGGVGLIPWLVVLATYLPASTRAWNWATAWVGLDSLEVLGLVSTGVLLIRRDVRYPLTAAATAALLLVDAWFDITTSAPGPARVIAIAMAVGLELPVSAVCAALAARGYPRRPSPGPAEEGIRAARAGGRPGSPSPVASSPGFPGRRQEMRWPSRRSRAGWGARCPLSAAGSIPRCRRRRGRRSRERCQTAAASPGR